MSLWAMITIVSVCGMITSMFLAYTRSKTKGRATTDQEIRLDERLDALEKRMANLETVLIHQKKEAKWDALRD